MKWCNASDVERGCPELSFAVVIVRKQNPSARFAMVSGKGWGRGILADCAIPFDTIAKHPASEHVIVNMEAEMVSCAACWTTLASVERYANAWK